MKRRRRSSPAPSRAKRRDRDHLPDGEARMRAIVSTAVDAIVTIDQRGRIDSCNPATRRLFGYGAAEMIGRNIRMLMPQPYRREHDGYMRRYLRTGVAHIIGIGREVMGQRKDGSIFPLALAVSEVRLGGGGRRMFTGIMHDLTARRRLERQVLEATAIEQRRIGHDLHDGLCQELVSLSMGAQILARKLEQPGTDPRSAVSDAERLEEGLRTATEQARRLAHGLNPLDVESGGLPGALEQLVRRVSESAHVACRFRWDRRARARDASVATHLYRITQEAISNALRHGKASSIVVELRTRSPRGGAAPGGLTLSIADDGCGFAGASALPGSAPAHAAPAAGIGLQTMSYRAKLIGGTFDVKPRARGGGGGTVVVCSVVEVEPRAGPPAGGARRRKAAHARGGASGADDDHGGPNVTIGTGDAATPR
jgi:two-component system CheB/CheR fusion protein